MATCSSSSLNPGSSSTKCTLAENRQRRTNAGSRLPQIPEAERDLSLPEDLPHGAAGFISSEDICIEEVDDTFTDVGQVTQVDDGEDSDTLHQTAVPTVACPEQNENLQSLPEEGHPGCQGTASISVLSVHCSCGTTVDDGKPLMPCLICGKYSHVSCAGYTICGSKMKRTKFYYHMCKTTKPSKKTAQPPLWLQVSPPKKYPCQTHPLPQAHPLYSNLPNKQISIQIHT